LPKYVGLWEAYPFNAGYFMCVKLKGLDAEAFCEQKYGGVIADGDRDIRVAFFSANENQFVELSRPGCNLYLKQSRGSDKGLTALHSSTIPPVFTLT